MNCPICDPDTPGKKVIYMPSSEKPGEIYSQQHKKKIHRKLHRKLHKTQKKMKVVLMK